ncbi:MAG: hypothetical protein IJ672_02380 [Methanobrevibacter sp.]|nr:hypothetical protein [Methanobrevibacter sp.]
MPSLFDIQKQDETQSLIKNYIEEFSEKTNRNVIVYYSGWLSVSDRLAVGINDMDKNGFMAMCHDLDAKKRFRLNFTYSWWKYCSN